MRVTILEWSAKEERYRSVTLSVSREQLRVTGKQRTYRDPHAEYDADASKRRRSAGSRLVRQDKHKFYIDRPGSKPMRIRYWSYRAINALLSHGHDVACIRHLIECQARVHNAKIALDAATAEADLVKDGIKAARSVLSKAKRAMADDATEANKQAVADARLVFDNAKQFAEPSLIAERAARAAYKAARATGNALRHADGSYAGQVEARGSITTPAGYIAIGRPAWVDTMLEGWDDRPDGGTHYQPSTMDAIRRAGTKHVRWSDIDVYARNDGSASRFTVTVNGRIVLSDATQDKARQWAASNDCCYDPSVSWWAKIEAADAARQFVSQVD